MTKLEQTNSILELINEGLSKGEVKNEEIIGMALLDIAKSLAIIADGIPIQNEQLEKIESDIYKIERRYDAKSVRWP